MRLIDSPENADLWAWIRTEAVKLELPEDQLDEIIQSYTNDDVRSLRSSMELGAAIAEVFIAAARLVGIETE